MPKNLVVPSVKPEVAAASTGARAQAPSAAQAIGALMVGVAQGLARGDEERSKSVPEASPVKGFLSGQLEQLEALGPELEKATEMMNAGIVDAQEALADLKVGVSAHTKTFEFEQSIEYLGFRKWDGKWQLVLERTLVGSDDEDVMPLLSATRNDRVHAIAHLPELMAALIEEATKEIQVVNNATRIAAGFAKFARSKKAAKK